MAKNMVDSGLKIYLGWDTTTIINSVVMHMIHSPKVKVLLPRTKIKCKRRSLSIRVIRLTQAVTLNMIVMIPMPPRRRRKRR